MDRAFFWLAVFIATQIAVMGLGVLPLDRWRSRPVGDPDRSRAGREA
jgi:hypothetical protein